MPAPSLRLFFACLFALAVHASPPLDNVSPATVGEGPLVFFIHPEDETGRPHDGDKPRTEMLYVCDPASGIKATPIWRGDSRPVEPVERLTRDLVVIDRLFDCYILNLPKGSASPLWPGKDQTKFLKAEDGKVHFLRRLVPDTMSGIKLKSGKNGKTVPESWDRPRDKLCALIPGDEAGAVELAVPVLEYIMKIGPEGIWAVTADEPRKLCLITGGGKVTDIIPFDPHWVASRTHAVFSPARDYVALSVLHDEQDFFNERELVVVDVKRKAIAHVSHNVPLNTPAILSVVSPIEMIWLDGMHLLFGSSHEPRKQVLDLPSGALSPATEAQLRATTPPEEPDRKRIGLFDSEGGKLWFAGDKKLAGSVLDERGSIVTDMEISKDGKWAALCDSRTKGVFLLDGAARKKRRLVPGWAYDIKWLRALATGK